MEAPVTSAPVTSPARENARGLKGWLKFFGVMSIIAGAINALSLIGLLWAWLPIWLGILLMQAGSRADDYAARGDEPALADLLGKLKTYYLISGIMALVSLGIAVLVIMVFVVMAIIGAVNLPDLMESMRDAVPGS